MLNMQRGLSPSLGLDRFAAILAFFCVAICGILLRVIYAILLYRYYGNGEAGNVARAVGLGKGIADAWFEGSGPTAHVMPVSPLIAGAIYFSLRPHGLGAVVLALWSSFVAIGVFLLAALCCKLLGASLRTALALFTFLCLVPIYCFTEAVGWQAWDGGLATGFALATLAVVLREEQSGASQIAAKSFLPAMAFIINPLVGVATIALSFLSIVRRRRTDGLIRGPLILTLSLVLLCMPWTIRNWYVMHQPILTRDNLGLELTMGNYPEAVQSRDIQAAFNHQHQLLHPFDLTGRQAMLAAGGEFAYSKQLQGTTTAWMSAHRYDIARIWLRHLSEFLFPQRWMFESDNRASWATARAILADLISVIALISLGVGLVFQHRKYLYPAFFLAIVSLLSMPFQPIIRYDWIIYPLLCCLAVALISRCVSRLQLSKDFG